MTDSNPAANGFNDAPVIIGHRGAAGLAPENTLPSFEKAVACGVQAVELDVHLCEEQLVVIHDDTLERTTNGTGSVATTRLAELRALDAGGGARVPLLEEVLDVLPETTGVNIELKGSGTALPLAAFLPSPPPRRSIILSSFDHDALREFRSARDDYPLAPLFGRWRRDALAVALEFGSGYINLSGRIVTDERLEAICGAGLRALVYTINDPAVARRLIGAGAWGVFTDLPDQVNRAALEAG